MTKSASCLKQFFTACDAIQTEGTEVFGFVCSAGFFVLSSVITTHLDVSRRSWPRTKIVGMATSMAAGVFLLCRGMVIPQDHAWHTIAPPTIIIFTVSAEAGLLIHAQIKEDGGSNHLVRDLLMRLADTSISIYRWTHLIRQTRHPLDAEKILRLVGSGLPVLIGACQVAWIAYKAGFVREVVEWLRKIPWVFAGKKTRMPELPWPETKTVTRRRRRQKEASRSWWWRRRRRQ
ncbi:uncharacterized protein LOC104582090 [Brachypodium distachyon]|uniref:uncharacterized protein LOC104582090 n=1 Tax=Brachypodium distachyon TaxID=15368 RepID=UPI000D0DA4D1|nr:uncharacterized protein LOC104582090 [Brachypodium distachyon]|eukprot:XP_010229721.2 uncharacterized protein LOC104582090 [Brachypodium distachyon]